MKMKCHLSYFQSLLCACSVVAGTRTAPAEALDNWHGRNPVPTANRLAAVAYGNGLFVAVGDSEIIQTSADTVHWLPRHSGSNSLRAVTYGNGRFVAVG